MPRLLMVMLLGRVHAGCGVRTGPRTRTYAFDPYANPVSSSIVTARRCSTGLAARRAPTVVRDGAVSKPLWARILRKELGQRPRNPQHHPRSGRLDLQREAAIACLQSSTAPPISADDFTHTIPEGASTRGNESACRA